MSAALPTSTTKTLAAAEQAMAQALTALLDETPLTRRRLPHLCALEVSLRRNGLTCIEQASYPVLLKVSQQLADVPDAAADPDLADLQDALMVAMARKRPPPAHAQLEDLGGGGVVEVSEVTHSAFMAIANGGRATWIPGANGQRGAQAPATPAFPCIEADTPSAEVSDTGTAGPRGSAAEADHVESDAPLSPGEKTLPLGPWEATLPLGPWEATLPLGAHGT